MTSAAHSDAAESLSVADGERGSALAERFERYALWLLIGIFAWVQFPLGSARPWAWSMLTLLVALNWVVWLPAGLINLDVTMAAARRVAVPATLMSLVLVWATLQTVTWMPETLHNPIWQIPRQALGVNTKGAVSLNPYDTTTETMKLLTYVAAGWLAFVLSTQYRYAHKLFVALFFVGVAYSIYGIILSALGTSQITLIEGIPPLYGRDVTGGFVAKNSFATVTGMLFIVALALVSESGANAIITWRGWLPLFRTLLQFIFGRGAVWLIGSIILFTALVAADSRAGLIATLLGLTTAFCFTLIFAARRQTVAWTLLGGAVASTAIIGLFVLNGSTVGARFDNLIETAGVTEFRPVMWQAAELAVADHPLTGIGLGAYHDGYFLYADKFVPYVIDRAHNDYLELAAGLGIPAALMWIGAVVLTVYDCGSAALRRRRRRIFSITAVSAASLVGFHSIFDFSLQMPAVSLCFAVLMGIGLGQSGSNRRERAR